jgi:hypothetical protein
LRLDISEPAPARLTLLRGRETLSSAEISKRSREPIAEVRGSARSEQAVEITASEGQPFRLCALEPANSRTISGGGPHWIALDVAGEGADELPATALLARMEPKGGATVLASDLPRIGQGQAWRRRFNLRGTSTILFEATEPVPVAVKAEGVGTRVSIEPLLGRNAPRADGHARNTWDLEAGWYSLRIDPVNNAVGVLDLTFGPAGLMPDLPKPAPDRLTIPFGVHTLAKGRSHRVLVGIAPGLATAPIARAIPADLGAAPITVVQTAGEPFELPVRLPAQANVRAAEPSGAAVPFASLRETLEETTSARIVTLRLAPVERQRVVVLKLPRDGVGVGVERPTWAPGSPGATYRGGSAPSQEQRAGEPAWRSRSTSRRAEPIASTYSVSGGRPPPPSTGCSGLMAPGSCPRSSSSPGTRSRCSSIATSARRRAGRRIVPSASSPVRGRGGIGERAAALRATSGPRPPIGAFKVRGGLHTCIASGSSGSKRRGSSAQRAAITAKASRSPEGSSGFRSRSSCLTATRSRRTRR